MCSITCPYCKETGEAPKIFSMDAGEHPQLREAILSNKIFGWQCPSCGRKIDYIYNSWYFDPEYKLNVVVLSMNEQPALADRNALLAGCAMPGYLHRIVDTAYGMAELLRIAQAGLDDRIVNLIKPLVIGALQSQGKLVWNGFFAGIAEDNGEESQIFHSSHPEGEDFPPDDDYLWFDIYLTDMECVRCGTDWNFYRFCKKMLETKEGADDGTYRHICLDWAIEFHREYEKEWRGKNV